MINGLGHVAFKVSDLDKSLHFYCDILGLKKAFTLDSPEGQPWLVYIKINADNFIELFPGGQGNIINDSARTGYQHVCLLVDDMQSTLNEMSKRGLSITESVKQGKDGNYQYWITDPDGNRIELMQIMPDSLQDKAKGL